MAPITSSSPLLTLLLIFPILLLRFDVISASGKFKVSVFRITNYRRARMDGNCCGSASRASHHINQQCPNECVTCLRVCLKEYIDHEIPDSITPHEERCTFGNMTTGQVGTSSFVYTNPLEGTFKIDFQWTVSFLDFQKTTRRKPSQ